MNIYVALGVIQTLVFVASVVATLSLLYCMIPARRLARHKPFIAFFPKYAFEIDDLEAFSARLLEQGFVKGQNAHYYRGSYFGDFLPHWAKLRVRLDPENRKADLASPFTAILFDTGDLWKISQALLEDKGLGSN